MGEENFFLKESGIQIKMFSQQRNRDRNNKTKISTPDPFGILDIPTAGFNIPDIILSPVGTINVFETSSMVPKSVWSVLTGDRIIFVLTGISDIKRRMNLNDLPWEMISFARQGDWDRIYSLNLSNLDTVILYPENWLGSDYPQLDLRSTGKRFNIYSLNDLLVIQDRQDSQGDNLKTILNHTGITIQRPKASLY